MKAASWLERRYIEVLCITATGSAGLFSLVAVIAALWAICCIVPQGWTIDADRLAADLDATVPIGATIDDARAWGILNGVALHDNPDPDSPNRIESLLAYQPDRGWRVASDVVVMIRFGRDGRVTHRSVEREFRD